jgi:hypothetical protein
MNRKKFLSLLFTLPLALKAALGKGSGESKKFWTIDGNNVSAKKIIGTNVITPVYRGGFSQRSRIFSGFRIKNDTKK